MTYNQFDIYDTALLEMACDLYQSIGHDLQAAAGLGTEDAYVEDEEVASILQDRMRDYLLEHGTNLVPLWDALSDDKRFRLCLMAL